ncbi:MAG: DMT family transporter [Gammaproteobacteria bacterium]
MLWVFTTLIAAVAQTARNAMQSSLTATLGTLGATQVRFIYGLPFALVFLGLMTAFAHERAPAPTLAFLAFVVVGALAQIAATAFLLVAMQLRSFSVATALSKTEALQVAVFGFAVLGDALTWPRAIAVLIATAGVVIVAVKPGQQWDRQSLKPAALGVASGAFFALASVSFRGAILALPEGVYFLRATTTLVWSLGIQVAVLGAWLAIMNREALLRSIVVWRQSLFAGFMSAFASQLWFLGFSLTAAANVRTLALVEVLLAQAVSKRLFGQRATARELVGVAFVVLGVAWLLIAV